MSARRRTDLLYPDGRRASWESIRQHVLASEPNCARCGAPSTEVDHIWPRHYGGDDRRSNLQGLCTPCNRSKANTVEPGVAQEHELTAAIVALTERITRDLDDLHRSIPFLIAQAVTYHGQALSDLRLARNLVGVAADEANGHYDLLTEWCRTAANVEGDHAKRQAPAFVPGAAQ